MVQVLEREFVAEFFRDIVELENWQELRDFE
jgi:hypothetical protein